MQPLEFRVLEVLKGSKPSRLIIPGALVAEHRVNTGSFPYEWPRHRGGTCWAYEYVVGNEYLLVLRPSRYGVLTPYWASMTLANEQLRAHDDPWLAFVRKHLRAAHATRAH
jgi:hypothetical protein